MTNLQRQILYDLDDVGKIKVEVSAKKIKDKFPWVNITWIHDHLTSENASDYLQGSDVIVDGTDNFQARRAINLYSLKKKIPYVFAGAVGYQANMTTFVPGRTGCLDCLFFNADDESLPTCETVGIFYPILPFITSVQVSETIKLLLNGQGDLEEKLLVADFKNFSVEMFAYKKNPNCPTCGKILSETSRETIEGNEIKKLDVSSYKIRGLCGRKELIVLPSIKIEVDLDRADEIIQKDAENTIKLLRKTTSLAVFQYKNYKISLFRSGNMIIHGTSDVDRGRTILHKLLPLVKPWLKLKQSL